jgi:hypothetical protein
MVVEDRALDVADALVAAGHAGLAARLRETVPASFGRCDEHVPLLREVLAAVVGNVPAHAASAQKVLAALDDLPSSIGRRGQVWVGRNVDDSYSAYWADDDWLEQGPTDVPLDVVLAWAERRSSDIRRNDAQLSLLQLKWQAAALPPSHL